MYFLNAVGDIRRVKEIEETVERGEKACDRDRKKERQSETGGRERERDK